MVIILAILIILVLVIAFQMCKKEYFYTSGASMRDSADIYISYDNVQERDTPGFYARYKYRTV